MEKDCSIIHVHKESLRSNFLGEHDRQHHQNDHQPFTVTVQKDQDLVAHLARKLESLIPSCKQEPWKHRSIYLVPSYKKDLHSKSAYEPKMVSIGPYHHGEDHLVPMEEYKLQILHQFLARSRKSLREYMVALEPAVEELMGAYERLDPGQDRGQFLEIMIVDGCFLIEMLRAIGGKSEDDCAVNSPLFSFNRLMHRDLISVIRDMLMIENQVPLLVLEKLLCVENGRPSKENVEFIKNMVVEASTPDRPLPEVGVGQHILDIYRKAKIHGQQQRKHIVPHPEGPHKRAISAASELPIARSATDLHEAGVKFRQSKTYSLIDITFNHGILSLPVFIIRDMSKSALLNLITFERLHPDTGAELHSYFFFIACLLQSKKDVRLLQSMKLIESTISSDEGFILQLIKTLTKDIVHVEADCSLQVIQHQLNGYYKKNMKSWSKRVRHWRSNLIDTYFKSPWTVISLLGASLLILLTATQSLYTVRSFYKN